jgi:hypothetical protein
MFHTLAKRLLLAVAVIGFVAHVAHAGIPGTVTDVDDQGMVTIQTEDGKEHQLKMDGVQVGDKVECDVKNGKMVCEKQ